VATQYKAIFRYGVKFNGDPVMSKKVSIHSFEVAGGSKRAVDLSSTDDRSIFAELERARSLKNLTLYLPPQKDGVDMEVVLELSGFFKSKSSFISEFKIERHSNGKMLEGVVLLDQGAALLFSPLILRKQLAVAMTLPAAGIWSGKYAE